MPSVTPETPAYPFQHVCGDFFHLSYLVLSPGMVQLASSRPFATPSPHTGSLTRWRTRVRLARHKDLPYQLGRTAPDILGVSPLQTGDTVLILGRHPTKWDKTGTIVEVLQYGVRTDGSGRLTSWNRRFLRRYTPHPTEDVPPLQFFTMPAASHSPAAIPIHVVPAITQPRYEPQPEPEPAGRPPTEAHIEPESGTIATPTPPPCSTPVASVSPSRSYASSTQQARPKADSHN